MTNSEDMVEREIGARIKNDAHVRAWFQYRWELLKEWRRDCGDYIVADDQPITVEKPVELRGEHFIQGVYTTGFRVILDGHDAPTAAVPAGNP